VSSPPVAAAEQQNGGQAVVSSCWMLAGCANDGVNIAWVALVCLSINMHRTAWGTAYMSAGATYTHLTTVSIARIPPASCRKPMGLELGCRRGSHSATAQWLDTLQPRASPTQPAGACPSPQMREIKSHITSAQCACWNPLAGWRENWSEPAVCKATILTASSVA
jgi:hypothetical protein